MVLLPAFTASVRTVFIGTGNPALFIFSSIVKGRTDCSYDMPLITPSDAWLSNCMKCGWMLIFDAWKFVKSSSFHSLVSNTSTQS